MPKHRYVVQCTASNVNIAATLLKAYFESAVSIRLNVFCVQVQANLRNTITQTVLQEAYEKKLASSRSGLYPG
jgi:hypothetical protein